VYSNGGMRHAYFKLTVSPEVSRPRIAIEPYGIDFRHRSRGQEGRPADPGPEPGMGSMNWRASLEEDGGSRVRKAPGGGAMFPSETTASPRIGSMPPPICSEAG
jgi:hypothetical protein